MLRVIQSSRRKAPGNVGWSFIAEPRKHPECQVFFTSGHMFFVMGGRDDVGPARLGPRQPSGARPARDYPTAPGKDVWNCDGHENKMTKFARQCVEERVSCWHAQRCVRRYVCVCVSCQWTGLCESVGFQPQWTVITADSRCSEWETRSAQHTAAVCFNWLEWGLWQ